ncbi:hypothetical protein TL16_g01029 [Triparma laevis f. inornata]|uniref:Uncharacterized protein n=1 Tax=Triparma laevis f. inornata TaxID=1714386 RepID=A0A9W7DRD7_9STRA|nr:hypothetical protein TL16_g01029 [Triparma laevis f. inornata]
MFKKSSTQKENMPTRLPLSPVSSNTSRSRFSRSARKAKRSVKKGTSVVFTSKSKSPLARRGSEEFDGKILEDFQFEMPLDVEEEMAGAIARRQVGVGVGGLGGEVEVGGVDDAPIISKTNSFSAADAQRVITKGVVQQERERLARLEAENAAVSPKKTNATTMSMGPPPPKPATSPPLPPPSTPPAEVDANVHHHYTHAMATPLSVSMANDTSSLVTSLKTVTTSTMDRLRAIGETVGGAASGWEYVISVRYEVERSSNNLNVGVAFFATRFLQGSLRSPLVAGSVLSPKGASSAKTQTMAVVELPTYPPTPPQGTNPIKSGYSLDISSIVGRAPNAPHSPSGFLTGKPKPQLSPLRTNARSSNGKAMTPVRSSTKRRY